jgi:DNA-binding CsgD family transcriptional regulator
MPELLSRACEAARVWCGFSRALVVSVDDHTLSADGLAALADPASDALRRQLLAQAVPLRPGTAEANFIRLAEGGRGEGGHAASVLQEVLGLEHFALGAVMPEDRVLALLVLDRSIAPVDSSERGVIQVFAHLLGCSIVRLAMRQRMSEFAIELRHLTTSAQALVREGLESPITLPADYGAGSVFATAYPASQSPDQLRELFTRRELNIVAQMVDGRSNREIAAELQISPETVKTYVARVMRKLGASNRADAAVRFLRLTSNAYTG